MDDSRLASASADGIVKVFELHDNELVNVLDTYDDISTVKSFKRDENAADTPNTSILNLPLRKISCIAAFNDTVFWGDDGFNVKAFNTKTGKFVCNFHMPLNYSCLMIAFRAKLGVAT